MKKFQISAEFKMGSFPAMLNKEIIAKDEEDAKEAIMRRIGAKHKTPRRFINILSIAETSDVSVVDNSDDSKKE